jgi:1,4-alpha-glucan branching enzyme
LRRGRESGALCVAVLNFTPEIRRDYRIKVPIVGAWREIFNSDSASYGGGNVGNAGRVEAVDTGSGGELSLVLPPLAGIFLVPEHA